MMLSRKIACPSCDASLKISAALPEGRMIACPKCNVGFPVLAEKGQNDAPDTTDEDRDDEVQERRVSRKKFRKKKKAASKLPLVLGLAIGGVLLLGGGVAAVVIVRNATKKTEAVAQNSPPAPAPAAAIGPAPGVEQVPPRPAPQVASGPGAFGPAPSPGPGQFGPGPGFDPRPEPGAARPNPGANTGGGNVPESGGGQSQEFAAAKRIFAQNCTRCHTIGGDTAGGGGGAGGGPGMGRKIDLSGIGAEHNADWFAKLIRNPKSVKQGARMPSFEGRINAADLRALAQYLASLK